MADITLTIPDALLDEVLAAQETTWLNDAKRLASDYDELSSSEKLEACLLASLKVRTGNMRREAAERQAREAVPEVPLQRRRR